MKKLTTLVLFACVCVGLVLADSPKARFSPKAPFNDPTDVATVKQIEPEMGDAMVAVDIDKLNQIYADDFAAVAEKNGKIITRERILEDFKSGRNKLVSYELGPVDVQVLGNVAVCHGSSTEKRIWDGKDASGESVWMDLFEKRAGKWLLVRSAGASVKADSPHTPLNDPTDVATIKQIEPKLGDAIVAVDIEKLNQIYADDFAIAGSSGKIVTKEGLVQYIESGKFKLVSYELGPIDVQVLGNVAVGHGAVTEKRIADGKEVSVDGVWMDLFEKRAGKWVLVRSGDGFVR